MRSPGPTPQNPTSVAALAAVWRDRARELEPFAPPVAVAFRRCADELEAQLRVAADAVLTLAEAALASNFSVDHLRHEIAAGRIPNVGRKGRPRVRAGDLPRKLRRGATASTAYDPGADALTLVRHSRG